MKVKIYTFVLCPKDQAPSQENCKTSNVVATCIEDAFKCASSQEAEMSIVSFSYFADAVLSGTIVDFE